MAIGMDFLYPTVAVCINPSRNKFLLSYPILRGNNGWWLYLLLLLICHSLSSSPPFLQVNSWKWSPPGPLDPSPTHRPLYLMSYGRFPQGHVTPVLPHAPLQAWPTPRPLPPGEETLLASARAGTALTPQVNPQSVHPCGTKQQNQLLTMFCCSVADQSDSVSNCVCLELQMGKKSKELSGKYSQL